ncbi:MAG: S-layer homology domain-containing protein [Clostridiales bacterium]|nr:S-layer homology domain-containing protein [Clostridiales bacterium]
MENLFKTKKYRAFIGLLSILTLLFSLCNIAQAADPETEFPDLQKYHWANKYVSRLALMGAISGMPNGNFEPERYITRAEFIKVTVSAFLEEPEAPATGQHWASNLIKAAEDGGLLAAGEFAENTWNQPINRQEMAKIMALAMENVRKEETIDDTGKFSAKIKDFNSINKTYQPYVAQTYAKGIIGGYPDGSFGGSKQATRAEACTMIMRILDPYYRLDEAVPNAAPDSIPSWSEIIGTVNGINIYRYEYNYYFTNAYMDYFQNNYYGNDEDFFDEEGSLEILSDIEKYAWETSIQASLIRQMAYREYQINLESNYLEKLLLPDTIISINTNRLYNLLYHLMEEEAQFGEGFSEAEAKEYYQDDPTFWDCRKVAHIIITPEQMMDEATEKGKTLSEEEADKAAHDLVQDIITQLNKGEDFAKLALQYSADSSAQNGGEMDIYFNIYGNLINEDGSFDPLFAAGAFLLEDIGDFSEEPVKSSFGYHIVKLLDKKEGFEAAKAYIMNIMQAYNTVDPNEYLMDKLQTLEDNAIIVRKFSFKYYIEE